MKAKTVITRSVLRFFRPLVAVAAVVCLVPNARAQPDNGEAYAAFSEAYAAYTSAIEAGDQVSALAAAKLAYEHGLAHFGRLDSNTAALAMNYGNMLTLSGADNVLAAEIFSEADAIYEDLYGTNSMQRLEALLALASVQETFEEKLATINAALGMHRALFPEEDIAYARLQSQGGELLASARNGSEEARRILTQALDTLESEFGNDAPELLSTLFALGNATVEIGSASRQQLGYFDRALEIAEASESDEAVAVLELQVALKLNRQSHGYRDAIPYIRSALGRYERQFGSDHPNTVETSLILGQALIASGDDEEGEEMVKEAIAFYDGKPAYVSSLIRARQLLMSAYSARGDDDQFTAQSMEVGRLSEGLPEPVDYLPIVKVAPAYPMEAAARGAEGCVVVQYTVDEEGRTRHVVVVESDSEGIYPAVFHDPAIASARKYRYIPRFENGVPVSVPNATARICFEITN